ncbi:MAG: hypothetical protein O7B35_10015 [Deltaproteobacteria bacterium]|nr:hypothetical protein [Deltaproteobacteria bacterium]
MIRGVRRDKISLPLSVVPIPAFLYHNETIFTFSKKISFTGDERETPLLDRFRWARQGRLSACRTGGREVGGVQKYRRGWVIAYLSVEWLGRSGRPLAEPLGVRPESV